MSGRPLEELSREELIRELRKLQEAARAAPGASERDQLVHDLRVHQVELEMQNRELREAQLRLEEASERYAELYDHAPVGYCTLSVGGAIREINLVGAALLGKARKDLLGQPFAAVAPLEDSQPFLAHLERCKLERARATSDLTFRAGRRGSRAVHVISEPVLGPDRRVTAFRTILIDISELKRLENKLRVFSEASAAFNVSLEPAATAEALLNFAVPALADLCMLDMAGEDGKPQRLVSFADRRKQETLAGPLKELRTLPGWRSAQARVMETGEPMLLEEVPPGERRPSAHDDRSSQALRAAGVLSLIVAPLSARGRTFGALTLAMAESERRYTPVDLRLAQGLASRAAMAMDNARLYAEAQRAIAARDGILGIVSHDLRNPLGIIVLNSSLLLQAAEQGRKVDSGKAIATIHRCAKRMNRLIQDLLDMSSIDAGRLAVLRARQPVRTLLAEAVEPWQAQAAEKALSLRYELSGGDELDVDCDRDRAQQVLGNLIGNAIKFTPPGGRVTVRAEPREGQVAFSVADTGPGIAPADLEHVFERFWQAKKTAHLGTGLGLSISKGIVEAHGGRIWVESRPGAGTTFTFTLPMPQGEPKPPPAATAGPSRTGHVVLVAEDERDERETIRQLLQNAGYEVVTAANGAEALDYLQHHSPPFLVILDLLMPVMDGWALLAERNRDAALRSIPVIVVSGQRDIASKVAAAHAGYVEKPIEAGRLIDAVAHTVH